MSLDKYIEVCTDKLFYNSPNITTSNNIIRQMLYADWTATAKVSPYIEKLLVKYVYPYYSNTHSNSQYGLLMKKYIDNTKYIINKCFNLTDDHLILFIGSGCTGAINYLIKSIDFEIYDEVYIYISIYEHHSNYLPWVLICNIYKSVKLIIIPLIKDSEHIDLNFFKTSLQNILNKNSLIICSIISASNVNGYILPISKIKNILNKTSLKYFLFSDYACSSPYIDIDASIFDAIFLSPHKMVGGAQTPGILIAKKQLFTKSYPLFPGGGCVKMANSSIIEYESSLESRESAGTPDIIGIIRIGLVIKLKYKYFNFIKHNEKILFKYMKFEINRLSIKYPIFKTIFYDKSNNHLPILSFNIFGLHHSYISSQLNDKYAIQSRSGISCAGLLAEYCELYYNIKGWCRISFHWSMKKKEILYIFECIEDIIINTRRK